MSHSFLLALSCYFIILYFFYFCSSSFQLTCFSSFSPLLLLPFLLFLFYFFGCFKLVSSFLVIPFPFPFSNLRYFSFNFLFLHEVVFSDCLITTHPSFTFSVNVSYFSGLSRLPQPSPAFFCLFPRHFPLFLTLAATPAIITFSCYHKNYFHTYIIRPSLQALTFSPFASIITSFPHCLLATPAFLPHPPTLFQNTSQLFLPTSNHSLCSVITAI